MVLVLLKFEESPWILVLTFQSLFTLNFVYLVHARANEQEILNWLEYVNELFLIAILHLMLSFLENE